MGGFRAGRSWLQGRLGYKTVVDIEADIDQVIANSRAFNTGTDHGAVFITMADAMGTFAKKVIVKNDDFGTYKMMILGLTK